MYSPTPFLAHAPAGFDYVVTLMGVIYGVVALIVALLLPALPAIILLRPRCPLPAGLPMLPTDSGTPLIPRLLGAFFFNGFGLYCYLQAAHFLMLLSIIWLSEEEMEFIDSHTTGILVATALLFFLLEGIAFLLRWCRLRKKQSSLP